MKSHLLAFALLAGCCAAPAARADDTMVVMKNFDFRPWT